MSWFSTAFFHFELPGEAWEEQTLNIFRPTDDERSYLMVGRAKIPETGPIPVAKLIEDLPMGEYDERKIIRHEWRQVGPLEGEDVGLFARSGTTGEYYRFVSVPYYDLEVTFQFVGPMAQRGHVDRRAESTLQSVRFRKR